MAIYLSDLGKVYLVCGKTDMRQGIDSHAYLVKRQFELDPFLRSSLSLLWWTQRSLQGPLLGWSRILATL
ncbi:IS66 family insertion sequence element accessory protein TnpB [Streptococcus thoraltensis]|uniref:IS66 family insertion sequence element accessory protein TnpB n=1 Tax=Streptococcus thoraltensis TaxID=55085 RepID=UPI0030EE8F1B